VIENNVGANNYSPQGKNRNRRSIRLKGYDYSRAGAYFVSICTHNRACLFGEIADRQMVLTDAGRMVERCWNNIPSHFSDIELDSFVIMPNHIHGILVITETVGANNYSPLQPGQQGEHKVRPYGTLPNTAGQIVQGFKSVITHKHINGVKHHRWPPFPGKSWQRNYCKHVIRDKDEPYHVDICSPVGPGRFMAPWRVPASRTPAICTSFSGSVSKSITFTTYSALRSDFVASETI
jgi:REP element-mobilizing transposase RayT